MPRSGFGPHAWPSAATYTTSGLVGWIATRLMWRVSPSPRLRQLCPPSSERYTPSPCDTLLRMHASPVPAYTTLGCESDTAMAPTAAVLKNPSETFHQCEPPLVVLKTPPAQAPK